MSSGNTRSVLVQIDSAPAAIVNVIIAQAGALKSPPRTIANPNTREIRPAGTFTYVTVIVP